MAEHMQTMRCLRSHRRGGPETLALETAPIPVPAAGELLVRVHAAGITFDELLWDLTWTRDGLERTPIIPSHEVSGVIAKVGEGVTGVAVGDEVYGLVPFDRDGAAADFVVLPAANIAARPSSVSHEHAASVPLSALTAWQALTVHARIRAGEQVLIQGGAGSVGLFAVQLAALAGAHVTATCRQRDAALVKQLGASRVVDFERGHGISAPGSFDAVVDTVGGTVMEDAIPLLRSGGRLVTLSAPPPADRARDHGVDATFFLVQADRRQLAELSGLVDSGCLRTVLASVFPLAQGRAAYESGVAPGRAPGKTVLSIHT